MNEKPYGVGLQLGASRQDDNETLLKLSDLIEQHLPLAPSVQRELLLSARNRCRNVSNDVALNKSGVGISRQEIDWLCTHPEREWIEYLIFREHLSKVSNDMVVAEFPPYVLIEPTSVCNLRCVMCFQVDKTFTKDPYMGMMDLALFKKVVDECEEKGAKAITLASRGEPTLHPKFDSMLDYLGNRDFLEIKINTNATKLSEKICDAILRNNVTSLVFSVDAATKETYEQIRVKGKFDKVVQNIERFNKVRMKYRNPKTVTRISGVKVRADQSKEQMIDFWAERVDEVTIKDALPRWDSYNNEVDPRFETPCRQLFDRMYVWYDGTVNPCDFDYKSYLSPGNVATQTLAEIWHGDAYTNLRQSHLAGNRNNIYPCDRCPIS